MEKVAKQWIERANYDFKTAEAMLISRRYLYVAFMCQQSLEKMLKAIAIQAGKDALRTHNLVRLAEIAEVYAILSTQDQDLLADLTPFAIEARYGDYRDKLSEIINKRMAVQYFDRTRGILKCLKRKIKK
jgi:HEPN domain-containing protein